MAVCDGCGSAVDEAHIRRRIERLELATRFRPIHIQFLLLDTAPPVRVEDYFYRAASDSSKRSLASRMFFDELAKCAGYPAGGGELDEEVVLAEFQRRGFFLAYGVECPLEEVSEAELALNRLGPTVVRRIQSSYKPKFVAPLGQPMAELIPLLELSGLSDRLILSSGGPFVDPFLGDPQNQAEFGTALGDRLTKALSSHLT
jgi:hypothetical protein